MADGFNVQKYWEEVNSRRRDTEWLIDFYNNIRLGSQFSTNEEASRANELAWIRRQVFKFGWRSVLDAGCGPGFWFQLWKELGLSATGVDRAEVAIPKALQMADSIGSSIPVSHSLLSDLPFADQAFNVAVTVKVLIHTTISDIVPTMRELGRVADNICMLEARYAKDRPIAAHVFDHDFVYIAKSLGYELLVEDHFSQRQVFLVFKTR
jgi:SAM-dependent methyltransferase